MQRLELQDYHAALYICCRKSCRQLLGHSCHTARANRSEATVQLAHALNLTSSCTTKISYAYHGVQPTTAQGVVFMTAFVVPCRVMLLHVFPRTTCEAIPDRSNHVHHLS